jgi:uncharacterized protein
MLKAVKDGVTLAVRLQPGAKKTLIKGTYGQAASLQLNIAVQAQPIEGRANVALLEFLAEIFSLPKSAATILSGESSRTKIVLLRGISLEKAAEAVTRWAKK